MKVTIVMATLLGECRPVEWFVFWVPFRPRTPQLSVPPETISCIRLRAVPKNLQRTQNLGGWRTCRQTTRMCLH